MKTISLVLLVATIVMVCAGNVYAIDRFEGMTTKLGRGVTNVCTSVLEFGNEIDYAIADSGIYKGTVFGFMRGLGKGLMRLGAGVYEIITFPIEYPENYKPVLDPEYVFVKE